jgi:hypothetical protein
MADKNWSLTDCASCSTLEEEQFSAELTHDRHFAQAGFPTLLRQTNIVSRACTEITRSPLMSVRRHLQISKKRPEGGHYKLRKRWRAAAFQISAT